MAKERELIGIRNKLMEAKAQMMIEERAIMTPVQIEKLGSMPMGMGGMGYGCMGRGMMGPG